MKNDIGGSNMRIKISIILTIIFSLININCFGINKNIFFEKIEDDLRIDSCFVENGIKLQYTTDNKIEDESKKIKGIFKGYKCVESDENNIDNLNFCTEKRDAKACLWREGEKLYVEIIINNRDKNQSTNDQYYLLNKI